VQAKAVQRAFTASLHELSATIDERNKTRAQPFLSFSPRHIELAVSI
jgi:hypothetical protein